MSLEHVWDIQWDSFDWIENIYFFVIFKSNINIWFKIQLNKWINRCTCSMICYRLKSFVDIIIRFSRLSTNMKINFEKRTRQTWEITAVFDRYLGSAVSTCRWMHVDRETESRSRRVLDIHELFLWLFQAVIICHLIFRKECVINWFFFSFSSVFFLKKIISNLEK